MIARIFIASLILIQLGCAEEEESLDVSIRGDNALLISATTKSCQLRRTMEDSPPTTLPADDISSAFFEIDGINLAWTKPKSTLVISMIRVKTDSPAISCDFGGDSLAALSAVWWNQGRKALVGNQPVDFGDGNTITPAATLQLGCPLICGGVSASGGPFVAQGTIEIVGYSLDEYGNKSPVKVLDFFTVENPF